MMTWSPNQRPGAYVGPTSQLARSVCRAIFRYILRTDRVYVDLESAGSQQAKSAEADFVVAPPDLWTTLKILFAPNLWVGESYVAGRWYLIKGDLADFLETVQRGTRPSFQLYHRALAKLKGVRFFLRQRLLTRYYTRKVKNHYEVDSRIYELFLDDEMLYTCAFFQREHDDLKIAQENKLDAVIERLSLPAQPCRVLDIGCGWGGLARAIARRHSDAQIRGLSISESQISWARSRDAKYLAAEEAKRIEYLNEDYIKHQPPEPYDAVSVVGMIEHVGLSGYGEFFRKVHSLLRLGGHAVVHTIVSPTPAHATNPWIDRHIFTGGHTPSISELVSAAERARFRVAGIFVYPPAHYRRTIEEWLKNFRKNVPLVAQHLSDTGSNEFQIERFLRMWTFYLSGVRNMFDETQEGSHQIVHLRLRRV